MSDTIKVDTSGLRQYANRLSNANRRITSLDIRMNGLYRSAGLADLWKIMQADILTGYSVRVRACQSYLTATAADFERIDRQLSQENPLTFNKNVETTWEDIARAVNGYLYKKASKVCSLVEKGVNKVDALIQKGLDSYYSKGAVYKAIQIGKAAVSIGLGVVKIATGVGEVVVSGGGLSPVAILQVISGANDVYNGIMNLTYASMEDYDQIGKTNGLKDLLTDSGGKVGEMFGNKELGEKIGTGLYYGSEAVLAISSVQKSYSALKKAPKVSGEAFVKEIQGNSDSTFTMKNLSKLTDDDLRYQIALLKHSECAKIAKNAKLLYDVGDDTKDVGKAVYGIVTGGDEEQKNAGIEALDKVFDYGDKIQKGGKAIGTLGKYIYKGTKLVFG